MTGKNVHQVIHDGRESLTPQTSAVTATLLKKQIKGEVSQVKREIDGLSRKLGKLLAKL